MLLHYIDEFLLYTYFFVAFVNRCYQLMVGTAISTMDDTYAAYIILYIIYVLVSWKIRSWCTCIIMDVDMGVTEFSRHHSECLEHSAPCGNL